MTSSSSSLPPWKVNLLAVACAVLVANLYVVQPIAELVARDLAIARERVGILTTLPLAGYGAGLLFLAPLGDLVENRRLILAMTAAEALALLGLWLVGQPFVFLVVSVLAGLSASVIQVILPYTSQLLSGPRQGRAVARLVSGVMLGIMLARPASSFVAESLTWRTIYLIASALMILVTFALAFSIPARKPAGAASYRQLMTSMIGIFRTTKVLRRRAFYQTMMFGAFIAFWTSVPLWLARAPFELSQGQIAWVAFAGVAGALSPPIATRLVDAGHSRAATIAVMILAMAAMTLTLAASSGHVAVIVPAAILLDASTSAHLVIGQRAIYALAPELRSRLNAMFIATFFAGGAAASTASAWIFVHHGWNGVVVLGVAMPALALLYRLTERAS